MRTLGSKAQQDQLASRVARDSFTQCRTTVSTVQNFEEIGEPRTRVPCNQPPYLSRKRKTKPGLEQDDSCKRVRIQYEACAALIDLAQSCYSSFASSSVSSYQSTAQLHKRLINYEDQLVKFV